MTRQMHRQKGFTLVEVIIAIILSAIALFGIETLIMASFKDWRAGQGIVNLQRDLDIASYQIKGVLDEADDDTILSPGPTIGTQIQASYKNNWSKVFSLVSDNHPSNKLIYKNVNETPDPPPIINTLQSITFTNASDNHSVRVDLTVTNGTSQLSNSFLVYLRNLGVG